MKNTDNFRKEIVESLLPYFRKDRRYHLLVCDMGFGVTDRLREEFPDRITNCGIMEQGTVGIAAGMSMIGMIPIVYSIVNFLVFRALEQIRNDIILQDLNVKFIATGVNDYFSFLGPSHCCSQDDISLMQLINMKIYDPGTGGEGFGKVVEEWLQFQGPSYIRV